MGVFLVGSNFKILMRNVTLCYDENEGTRFYQILFTHNAKETKYKL